ncbi:hypothetical protein ACQP2T_56585 [Nonomuraea sp. CA-143628]|uniref:hypothetical protein n=1 Tax=Nonomuraea sp. CA-143628 TaxID=3239997 RepID=UPI003D94C9A1
MDDVEPALAFGDPHQAKILLHAYVEAQRDLDDRRDPLVRGALASGVDPSEVHEITGMSRSTIDRILAPMARRAYRQGDRDAVLVADPSPPANEYACILRARAKQLWDTSPQQPASPNPGSLIDDEFAGRAMIYRGTAKMLKGAPPPNLTEDAWLQSMAARFRRAATSNHTMASPSARGQAEGRTYRETYLQMVREITAIRRYGQAALDPATGVFSAEEIATVRDLSHPE